MIKESITITGKAELIVQELSNGDSEITLKSKTPITLRDISILRDTLTRYLRKRRKRVNHG